MGTAMLPIGRDTLVYGSCDAGATVLDADPSAHEAMQMVLADGTSVFISLSLDALHEWACEVAGQLNLKGHWVGKAPDRKFMYGPVDIEVHRGRDGTILITGGLCLLMCFASLLLGRIYVADVSFVPAGNPDKTYSCSLSRCTCRSYKAPRRLPGSFLFSLSSELVKSNPVPLSSAFCLSATQLCSHVSMYRMRSLCLH